MYNDLLNICYIAATVYLTQFNFPLALLSLVDFYITMKLKSN